MMKRTLFITITFVALVLGTYYSWKKLNLNPSGPTTLSLSLDNPVESLDPVKVYSDDLLVLSAQVLEPLYQYHYLKRPYEIQALTAEGLPQIEEKGTVYKIKIHKGIYFHPHEAFNHAARELRAEDYVNQFKRLAMKSLKSPGQSLLAGLIIGFDEYGNKIHEDWKKIKSTPLEGVEAIDAYNLKITLKKAEPNLIYYLALNFIVPVPWELIQFTRNDLEKVMVGTGPYVYRGFNGSYVEMQKFNDYRLDFYPSSGDRFANVQNLLDSSKERIPFIDKIRFYVTKTETERWDMFLKHEVDLLTVPKTLIPKLYDEKGELSPELKKNDVILKHFPILANRWLAFNMRDRLLGKNDYLRRAIAFSIDYEKYIQVLSQNTNLRANSLLVPGISGYMPTKEFRFKYDPALAKEYLKHAGFSAANMPTIRYSTRGNQGINILEAEFLKTCLEAIGLKVEIEILPFADFIKKGRAGELMFFTDNWLFDYPDGENILQLLVSSNFPGVNKSGYSNPKVDELYNQLKETTNIDSRDKIIHQVE